MINEIIGFLGLFVGYILATKTREELKDGEKYFKIITYLMLISLIVILLNDLNYINLEFFIAVIIGIVLNYFIKRTYLFLGLSLAIINEVLLSVIIFVFGLAQGSLDYIKFKKINHKDIIINFIVFIIPIALFFNKFTMIFDHVLIGFAVGGIISGAYRTNTGFKEK